MNFIELLLRAQNGEEQSAQAILDMYKPLLVRESVLDGVFDEDMYQELCLTLLYCIKKFRI